MPPPPAEKRSQTTPELQTPTPSEKSPAADVRHAVHVVLQNKGGVGKTIAAMNLTQFLREERKIQVRPIDLDPMNHTLAEYAALKAMPVDLFVEGHADLKARAIDDLSQSMLMDPYTFVVDNGAAGFVRFGGYLAESDFSGLLDEQGRDLIIHAVIAGGDMTQQCLVGLNTIVDSFASDVPIVVWLNEHHGPIEFKGLPFEQMPIYTENPTRFKGLVRLPRLSQLFLNDFTEMLKQRLTYQEAIDKFHIMNKQRLVMIRRAVWKQLADIL